MKDYYARMVEPEVSLSRADQISALHDIGDRMADIVDDVKTIPDWNMSGALLGILAVAEGQTVRLRNIVANLESDRK